MQAFHPAGAPQFPAFGQVKTYAAHPVWKGSAREEIKFAPLPKKAAVKIFHDARRFERQTSRTLVDAYGRRSTQGKIGRMAILVLHAMLFDFLNYSSGRLDPSYAALAEKACVSIRSVARAIVRLRDAGILNWVKRCSEAMDDGRYILTQETNAYGVVPSSQWRGYRAPPEAPPPDPASWGASPPMASAIELWAAAKRAGDLRAAQRHLESDPGDLLAAAAARLARRR